ncbi:MAG: MBL fold metallo-hydrolase [Candidatus Micrarchaeia archaeon]
MKMMFLGEAGIITSFENGGKIAIDPVSYTIPKERISEECRNLRLILITHEHKEHFDRDLVEYLYSKYRPHVIAPKQVLLNLSVDSTYKSDVVVGDVFEHDEFEVHVMPAFHPQSKYAVSYYIKTQNSRLYYAGDTYEIDELYRLNGDVAFLPIRGMETMGALQVARISQKLKFNKIVPIYWSDRKDLVEFMLQTKNKAVKPVEGTWISI